MKEIGLLFNGAMVYEILAGRKRQTRRLMRPQPKHGVGRYTDDGRPGECDWVLLDKDGDPCDVPIIPWGRPGDRIWVRETWRYYDWTEEGCPYVLYRADDKLLLHGGQLPESVGHTWAELSRAENTRIDGKAADRKWRPSMFMPRWASRITLEVTEVRAQRLASITEQEAELEGVDSRLEFELLWDAINAKKVPFASNPWVWAISFEVVS
jgi:hypothetical protein